MRKWLSLVLLLPGAALAAPANPDRPSVGATSYLVAPGTLEGELGGTWYGYGGGYFEMPLLVKYSYQGTVEPRLGMDLAGFDNGFPGITAGAKVKLVSDQKFGLALLGSSNLPIGEYESWVGAVHLLTDIDFGAPVTLNINVGAELGDVGSTVGVVGVPVSLAVNTPVFGVFSGFLEGATVITDNYDWTVLDAGIGWRVTDAAVLDLGAGWNISTGDPFAMLGLTFNAGTPGG